MPGSQQKKPALSQTIKAYLLCYNVAQFIGWSSILYRFCTHYTEHGTFNGSWNSFIVTIRFFQTAAVLEIAHAAFGLLPSSAMTTFLQIQSRLWYVWLLEDLSPKVTGNPWVTFLFLCWTLTEIIRYLFYASAMINFRPYVLMWLRYSMFIVMYPCGVTGELNCIYLAYPEYVKTGKRSIQMPNTLNFTFYFPYVIIFLSLLYIPVWPHLYLRMLSQRKKILGTPPLRLHDEMMITIRVGKMHQIGTPNPKSY